MAPQSAKSQIRYTVRSCLDFSHMHASETSTNTLMALCRQIWNSPHNETHNISLDEDIICDILKTAINKGQFSFLEEAAAHHGGWLPERFFAWARRWLRTGENGAVTRFNTIQRGCTTLTRLIGLQSLHVLDYALPFLHSPSSPTSLGVSQPLPQSRMMISHLTMRQLPFTLPIGLVKPFARASILPRQAPWAMKMVLPW